MNKIEAAKLAACLLLVTALALAMNCLSYAAGAKNAGKQDSLLGDQVMKSDSPIHITADRMEAKQEDRTIIFEGHVLVQQDDLTLTGNKLKVAALAGEMSSDVAATDKIDYIEVEGNVKVTQKDRMATAEKAIYFQKEQKIVLHGRPVVTKGQDRIEGNLITIYLKQGKSIVESGGGSQVQAVLFPGKKE
jgi:lipopolysaccharide export system protein LptA